MLLNGNECTNSRYGKVLFHRNCDAMRDVRHDDINSLTWPMWPLNWGFCLLFRSNAFLCPLFLTHLQRIVWAICWAIDRFSELFSFQPTIGKAFVKNQRIYTNWCALEVEAANERKNCSTLSSSFHNKLSIDTSSWTRASYAAFFVRDLRQINLSILFE